MDGALSQCIRAAGLPPLQSSPVLKLYPRPSSCSGAQHCPPAPMVFKQETPEESMVAC